MHDCQCSDTLRPEVSVTLLNVIKSRSIDHTPFDLGDLDTCQDMPVGFTQVGYLYLGDPHAPVTLEKHSHLLFPSCARYFEQTVPILAKLYVQTGQAKCVASAGKDTQFQDSLVAGGALGFGARPASNSSNTIAVKRIPWWAPTRWILLASGWMRWRPPLTTHHDWPVAREALNTWKGGMP